MYVNSSDIRLPLDSRHVLTGASFPAQAANWLIPRELPVEGIKITVNITMAAAAIATQKNYGLLNIVKRIRLNANDGIKARNVVDVSGPGLLRCVQQESPNMDRSTLSAITAVTRNNLQASALYRICYWISCPHPMMSEVLRLRNLLPVHRYASDPTLTVEFDAAAAISATADPFTTVSVDVELERRQWPTELDQSFINDPDAPNKGTRVAGFINWDLIETNYTIEAGLTDQLRKFIIPSGGEYLTLLMHTLKGGATLTLGDISGSVSPLAAANLNGETVWQILQGEKPFTSFTMRGLQQINDRSRPLPGVFLSDPMTAAFVANSVAAADLGGSLSAGNSIQDVNCVAIELGNKGWTEIKELGALLDANVYVGSPQTTIGGKITTSATATNLSQVNLVGRRFLPDAVTGLSGVERWKKL